MSFPSKRLLTIPEPMTVERGSYLHQLIDAYGIPQRYFTGPWPMINGYGNHVGVDAASRDLVLKRVSKNTQQKEKNVTIEYKDYARPAVNVRANALAQKHLGSLVTITLPSGAQITDILIGVCSGHPLLETEGVVSLKLRNVWNKITAEQGHCIREDSVVQVRRKLAAKKTPAKKSRR